MLTWFRDRARTARTASKLYGSIVTHARSPAFYAELGVPDSLDGRYGVLVLHMWLALDRLGREGKAGAEVSRALIEAFVIDMDDNMREIGVGDLSVPRKVKKAAAGLYDRKAEYEAALTNRDGRQLAEAVARHVANDASWPGAGLLAAHVIATRDALSGMSASALLDGDLVFPVPAFSGDSP